MAVLEEYYDAVVIGAGHAGCEAALACARLGLETIVFTVSVESIAMMPCNPNIGGSSKGHLVREVDALGGEMGKNIDKTFIQSKMLNTSKGPSVHSLRAQADKRAYSQEMRHTMENTDTSLCDRCCMLIGIYAFSRCFAADKLHAFIRNKIVKHTDRIAAATDAGNYSFWQFPFFFKDLRSCFLTDHALEISDDHRERVWSHNGTEHIMRI